MFRSVTVTAPCPPSTSDTMPLRHHNNNTTARTSPPTSTRRSNRPSPRSINLPHYSPPPSTRSPTPHASALPDPTEPPDSPTTPVDATYFPSFPAFSVIGPSSKQFAHGVRSASSSSSGSALGLSRLRSSSLSRTNTFTESESETLVNPSFGDIEKDKMASNGSMKRKVVIMGAPSVGKTSLTQQFIAPPTYNEQYFPTIEATSHKTVKYEGVEYECEIIDSAGQDEYTLFPSKYAVGVHGYMLVYSINSRQSFEMVQTVYDKILDFAGLEKVPCVVVGQKCDLGGERRVTAAEGEALAKKLNAVFLESSAKDNKNVGKAFEVLLKEMQKTYNPAPEKKKSGWFGWGR